MSEQFPNDGFAEAVCQPCDPPSLEEACMMSFNVPHQHQQHQHQYHQHQYHQHYSYEMAKYTIDEQHGWGSAWRLSSGSVARYDDGGDNDMNCQVGTWFPDSAIAAHAEYESDENANANAHANANASASAVFTPFFLDSRSGLDQVDDYLALPGPPPLSFSAQVGTGTLDMGPHVALHGEDMLLDLGTDIDMGGCNTTITTPLASVMQCDGQTPSEQMTRPVGGIPEMVPTQLLRVGQPGMQRRHMHDRDGEKAERDAEGASRRLGRVRKGLAELEAYLRAHVKDQLLQMVDEE
ncbi:hypothetical protein E4U55_007209 [Claviceps digitariae]|nr:hypothetical protein E4U55_007209 [Claviceps digitariae]